MAWPGTTVTDFELDGKSVSTLPVAKRGEAAVPVGIPGPGLAGVIEAAAAGQAQPSARSAIGQR